jgi:hypothetical protein
MFFDRIWQWLYLAGTHSHRIRLGTVHFLYLETTHCVYIHKEDGIELIDPSSLPICQTRHL